MLKACMHLVICVNVIISDKVLLNINRASILRRVNNQLKEVIPFEPYLNVQLGNQTNSTNTKLSDPNRYSFEVINDKTLYLQAYLSPEKSKSSLIANLSFDLDLLPRGKEFTETIEVKANSEPFLRLVISLEYIPETKQYQKTTKPIFSFTAQEKTN